MSSKNSKLSGESDPLVAAWLGIGLLAATINTGLGVLLSDFGVNTPGDFLLTFASTLIVVLAIQAALWLSYRVVSRLVKKARGISGELLAATCVLPLAIVLPMVSFAPSEIGVKELLVIALVVMGALGISWVVYRRLRDAIAAGTPRVGTILVFGPLVAMLVLLFIWLFKVEVELVSNESGFPTWQAILTSVGLLLMTGASYVLCRLVTNRYGLSRPLLILTVGAVAVPVALAVLAAQSSRGAAATHVQDGAVKHVVLITVDTLRADSVGRKVRGYSLTPRLDELFDESLVFTHARSPSPWTKPAMASMMTGLSPLVHGATTRRSGLPPEATTIAESFGEAGYLTAAIGRNGSLSAGFKFDQGFDEFHIYPGGDISGNPALGSSLLRYLGLVTTNPSTRELAAMASHWIDEHADSSFFLWIHFFDPHAPYAPPDDVLPPGDPPPRIGRYYRGNGEVRGGYLVLDEREKAWVQELYDAEVSLVDQGVGQVIDSLEQNGIFDDSLVVFSSDHGEELFDHGLAGHGHTLFDEVLRVPLAIKLPGSSRTGEQSQAVSTEAVAATILDTSGVAAKLPSNHVASSLAWTWQGGDHGSAESPVVSTAFLYFQDQISVVFDNWKYIYRYDASPDALFSLEEDPREWNTLSSSQPEVVDEAKRIIDAYTQWVQIARQELGLGSGDEMELTPELREDLKALGYIQ